MSMETDFTRREFLGLVPALAAASVIASPRAAHQDICDLGLREAASMLGGRKLSAREVMTAHLDQIRRWNPRLNAIVAKLDDDACLALADAADAKAARGEALGALHGIPWAFKDLEPVVGFPRTRGSPIFRTDRPTVDSVLVERLRAAGVLPIGKTNTPESAWDHRRTTACTARRSTPTISRSVPVARAAVPPRPSLLACWWEPTAAISRDRCAIPRASIMSWGSGPPSDSFRWLRARCHFSDLRSRVRLRVPCRTQRFYFP